MNVLIFNRLRDTLIKSVMYWKESNSMDDHKIEVDNSIYQNITDHCLAMYDSGELNVFTMIQRLMDLPGVPMHYPYHHYMMPAVLLTVCRTQRHDSRDVLIKDLAEAETRAKNVLGGFCGFYGTCGAAVGVGIFYSVFTATTPVSDAGWALGNKLVSEALAKIAEVEGPRCCKRVCFLTLSYAVPMLDRVFSIKLPEQSLDYCKYSGRNAECRKEECPFYKKEME